MKYQILIDYKLEGWSFWDEGHDTLDEAVKEAQRVKNGNDFKIVTEVEWEAKEK